MKLVEEVIVLVLRTELANYCKLCIAQKPISRILPTLPGAKLSKNGPK